MKRFQCGCLVLLIALLATLPAIADKAKSFYSKGQQAEARQNYEEAYQYFKQAYDLHPEDTQYRSAFERSKFLAGSSHVHRGQILPAQDEFLGLEAMKLASTVGSKRHGHTSVLKCADGVLSFRSHVADLRDRVFKRLLLRE